jgi:RNA polymerase sigma-70 factor (ECF subfamily)
MPDVQEALETYSDMVYKIAFTQTKSKYDAEDVFQEVFMRLVEYASRITSEEHLKAWLIRVTLNCSKKHFKMWDRKTAELTDNTESGKGMANTERVNILDAVMRLSPKYRAVIHMFYYEDMTISEISEALQIKESTIKSQLNRGRALLKESLVS